MDREAKQRELLELRQRAEAIERELRDTEAESAGQSPAFYTVYHATAGAVLGLFGALSSLLFNVVGSLIVGQHALQLVRVYLTFPLGERALETETGVALAIGCCLYLATGMALGIPFHLILTRYGAKATWGHRFGLSSAMGVAVWLVNYYAILSWLQPWLFGGRWIIEQVPFWVAALTHLVFAWTMLLVQPLGVYVPYRHHWDEA